MTKVSSHAKAILIGEHSAVYGKPAIAVPLPSLNLTITYTEDETVTSWDEAWVSHSKDGTSKLKTEITLQLTKALEKACELCNTSLSKIPKGILSIHSKIPLGGGLGGSAALSVCCLRLISKITGFKVADEGLLANEIDSLFHSGKASGLDTQAVSHEHFIYFKKNHPIVHLHPKFSFWIVLIDSGERSNTSDMINVVASLSEKDPLISKFHFDSLEELTIAAKKAIEHGRLKKLGCVLNQAHFHLKQLQVSTPKIDEIVKKLRSLKALGAKLTGGGGGGLVLSLFEEKPPSSLKKIFDGLKIYEVELGA